MYVLRIFSWTGYYPKGVDNGYLIIEILSSFQRQGKFRKNINVKIQNFVLVFLVQRHVYPSIRNIGRSVLN